MRTTQPSSHPGVQISLVIVQPALQPIFKTFFPRLTVPNRNISKSAVAAHSMHGVDVKSPRDPESEGPADSRHGESLHSLVKWLVHVDLRLGQMVWEIKESPKYSWALHKG